MFALWLLFCGVVGYNLILIVMMIVVCLYLKASIVLKENKT